METFINGLKTNRAFAVTTFLVFLLIAVALAAPLLSPYDPTHATMQDAYLGPTGSHLFGTDKLGRDCFTRVLYGARASLSGVLLLVFTVFAVGTTMGVLSGYFGGKVDMVIMRITDIVQCVPGMLLTICLSLLMGSSIVSTVAAMSFGSIWGTARMLRGQILTVRESEYVEAAKATNNSSFRTIIKYVLPNSIQQTIIGACMGIGGAITQISGLSFLGLGIRPPLPEWGAMLSDGRAYMRYYPNMLIAPCVMLALTILSVSLFGDGLRDACDPRMKE